MFVLGLQGSPRKKGNTNFLLNTFMEEVESQGARTHIIDVCKKNIHPCIGCGVCEKKGFCAIDNDDMREIYPLLRAADVIIAATPIYFYSTTSQLKTLIDRCQTLWSRKYALKLSDPSTSFRQGYLLSLGATKGSNLFDGVELTAKYFFDAIGAAYAGSLTYRRIESPGDIKKCPTLFNDVEDSAKKLLTPLVGRKKVLFACRENACRSQIAAAFAKKIAKDRLEILSAGSSPAEHINPMMIEAMREKGIDMAFYKPKSIDDALMDGPLEFLVTMGCGEDCVILSGVKRQDWALPDPAGESIDFMRKVRDEIEVRVKNFLKK